jgi:hypothetical protein
MNNKDTDRKREIENYRMNGENERRLRVSDRQTDRLKRDKTISTNI